MCSSFVRFPQANPTVILVMVHDVVYSKLVNIVYSFSVDMHDVFIYESLGTNNISGTMRRSLVCN